MTARKVEFLAAARDEVREAFDWYQARSVRAAERFLAEIDRAIGFICEAPGDLWPVFEGVTRRYILHGFPYSIVYREVTGTVQVIAIAHHTRRPDYWHAR